MSRDLNERTLLYLAFAPYLPSKLRSARANYYTGENIYKQNSASEALRMKNLIAYSMRNREREAIYTRTRHVR